MSMSGWSGALSTSWKRHRSLLLPAYLGGFAVCAIAAYAGEGLHYYIDLRDGTGRFSGLMSLASGFALLAFGWSFLAVSRSPLARSNRFAWIGVGLLGVMLAFDEVLQLHEGAAAMMVRAGVPAPFGLDSDLYIFGAYAGIAAVLALKLRPSLGRLPDLALPALLAIVFFALSQGIDLLPWQAFRHDQQQWVGAAEEGSKCLGSWSLALLGLILLQSPEARRTD